MAKPVVVEVTVTELATAGLVANRISLPVVATVPSAAPLPMKLIVAPAPRIRPVEVSNAALVLADALGALDSMVLAPSVAAGAVSVTTPTATVLPVELASVMNVPPLRAIGTFALSRVALRWVLSTMSVPPALTAILLVLGAAPSVVRSDGSVRRLRMLPAPTVVTPVYRLEPSR